MLFQPEQMGFSREKGIVKGHPTFFHLLALKIFTDILSQILALVAPCLAHLPERTRPISAIRLLARLFLVKGRSVASTALPRIQ